MHRNKNHFFHNRCMALEATVILTQLAVLLLCGILGTILAHKLRISNVLILLLLGTIIGVHSQLFIISQTFLIALGITALVMVVFEGTMNFSLRQLEAYSGPAFSMTMWYLFTTLIIVTAGAYYFVFSSFEGGLILALILASTLAGTDASSVLLILSNGTGKVVRTLSIEAILNTPVMVLLPFIFLQLFAETIGIQQFIAIITQIVVGVGSGVLVGLILFKALRSFYAKDLSSVSVVTGALISYLLAENLSGNGVLAVATVGIIFGNVTIKKKEELHTFSFSLSTILEMLVFLLIGIMIGGNIVYTKEIFIISAGVFVSSLIARFIAAYMTFKNDYTFKQIFFTGITMPRGIAVAALIFIFSSDLYSEIPEVFLNVLFLVTIYSIIVATISALWWDRYVLTTKK